MPSMWHLAQTLAKEFGLAVFGFFFFLGQASAVLPSECDDVHLKDCHNRIFFSPRHIFPRKDHENVSTFDAFVCFLNLTASNISA